LEVATDTLDSWAVNLEMEADVKILNYRYGGKYTELDLYAVFRGDMKTRADYFKAMMGVGAMTPNQIRAREGQAPYPEGDKYYIATNNFTPVDRLDEVIDAQIEPKGSEPSGEEQPKEKKPSQIEDAVIKFLNK
jgi:Phage portal protein